MADPASELEESLVVNGKYPVNVLFTRTEYARLVRTAPELTLQGERRVSVAEMVRRLVLARNE